MSSNNLTTFDGAPLVRPATPEETRAVATQTLDPALQFPSSGYIGIAADFADLYDSRYESAKEFLYVDLLTLIGAMISGRVRANFGVPCQPRLYGLKVAPSAWERKSTSTKLADGFLRSLDQQMGSESQTPRIIYGVGSAEGLATAFAANPRIVLCYDEFRRFEAKASITSSALLPMVNEMYEQNDYDNLTLSHPISVRGGHLVLVSNTTTENLLKLVKAEELHDIGFLNRLTLLTAKSPKRQSDPQPPPDELLRPLREKLIQYLEALPRHEVVLPLTPEAKRTWDEWYVALDRVEETARLDNLGMRLMGVLAFTSGRPVIDNDLLRGVLDILEYERRVRRLLQPITGTPWAKMEQKIVKALQAGPKNTRDLYRAVHAEREEGGKLFREVLASMQSNGRIQLIDWKQGIWKLVW